MASVRIGVYYPINLLITLECTYSTHTLRANPVYGRAILSIYIYKSHIHVAVVNGRFQESIDTPRIESRPFQSTPLPPLVQEFSEKRTSLLRVKLGSRSASAIAATYLFISNLFITAFLSLFLLEKDFHTPVTSVQPVSLRTSMLAGYTLNDFVITLIRHVPDVQ